MEKIYLPLTSELKDPLDFITTRDGILCLHEYTEEGHDVSYPTVETATHLLKLNYGELKQEFDFSQIDNYDPVAQLVWEKTPLNKQALEAWLEMSYRMGFNPLPLLRVMLVDIPVLFTCSGTGFITNDPSQIGKSYLWVRWDRETAEVGLGVFQEAADHTTDGLEDELEVPEAEIAAAAEEEKVEFDVPELSGE